MWCAFYAKRRRVIMLYIYIKFFCISHMDSLLGSLSPRSPYFKQQIRIEKYNVYASPFINCSDCFEIICIFLLNTIQYFSLLTYIVNIISFTYTPSMDYQDIENTIKISFIIFKYCKFISQIYFLLEYS